MEEQKQRRASAGGETSVSPVTFTYMATAQQAAGFSNGSHRELNVCGIQAQKQKHLINNSSATLTPALPSCLQEVTLFLSESDLTLHRGS